MNRKRLDVVMHTCHPSNGRKHKIVCAKSKTLTKKAKRLRT
jgi:hypothetical protein